MLTITLILLTCLSGSTDKNDCKLAPLDVKFATEEQCMKLAPLIIRGLQTEHPEVVFSQRKWCTQDPEYVLSHGQS